MIVSSPGTTVGYSMISTKLTYFGISIRRNYGIFECLVRESCDIQFF